MLCCPVQNQMKIHHMSHVDLKLLELWKEVSKLKNHSCPTPMCCCLALSLEGSLKVQKLRQDRTSFVQGCVLSLRDSEVRQTASILHDPFIIFHLSSVNLLPSKPSSQQERTAAMFLLISWAGLLASGVTLWV